MAARPQRLKSDAFVKRFKLTAKDASLLLASQRPEYRLEPENLSPYYPGFVSIKADIEKYRHYYIASILVLFLIHIGGLSKAEIFGVLPKPEILKHISLLLVSYFTLFYSYSQAKALRFDNLFQAYFDRLDQNGRQELILRYPAAFSAMQFDMFISGRPAHMFAKRSMPIRLIFLLTLLVPAVAAMMGFTIWLIGSVGLELWAFRGLRTPIWSKALVATSAFMILFSILLPTLSVFSREYQHFGLVNLLYKLSQGDGEKHAKRIAQVSKIRERMGLSE